MQNLKTVMIETVSKYLELSVAKLCTIVDDIQRMIEEINNIMSGEKPMKADGFVSFIHKIQDMTTFYSFEEESKT